VAQTVERLPNKCKALNLNPNTAKKKKQLDQKENVGE
jgi:hypothetical protein